MLPEKKKSTVIEPAVARSTTWVRAGTSGIVSRKVNPGTTVRQGQYPATISDPLGDEEQPVTAQVDGIVIGRTDLPLAHEGDALFHFGTFDDVPQATDVVESLTINHWRV